jgi:hypothetical protein
MAANWIYDDLEHWATTMSPAKIKAIYAAFCEQMDGPSPIIALASGFVRCGAPEALDQKLARHFPPLGEDGLLPEGW